jgi:hypothetical protein
MPTSRPSPPELALQLSARTVIVADNVICNGAVMDDFHLMRTPGGTGNNSRKALWLESIIADHARDRFMQTLQSRWRS